MPSRSLLPRSTPAASGVSSRAVSALLDVLEQRAVRCHSLMVVRHGHVVAEGWWAPYTPERPHLLYSLTKTFTGMAVGLAVEDGLLALDDRVVDVLPDHVLPDAPAQAHRLTVHHLLTMTAGHADDTLADAWRLEPRDLVRGFLRMPVAHPEGTRHTYDNATTYVLARIVERVTGRELRDLLDERLFAPLGIDDAEWDTVATGRAFGFHGLHLRTEAVAAFGELLLRGGRWGDRQLIAQDWVERATRPHVETFPVPGSPENDDALCGYGYQLWMSRHGYRGHGAYGQRCIVVPSHDLVVAVTGETEPGDVLDPLWEVLLPALDDVDDASDDQALADRLRTLARPLVAGDALPGRSARGRVDAPDADAPLPPGSVVDVVPSDGGWSLRLGEIDVAVGHGAWRESAPLGRPVVSTGAWQGDVFVAELTVVTTPHRVHVRLDATTGVAVTAWSTVPLTTPRLDLHLRAPLMTRPDVA